MDMKPVSKILRMAALVRHAHPIHLVRTEMGTAEPTSDFASRRLSELVKRFPIDQALIGSYSSSRCRMRRPTLECTGEMK